ncbi:MAG: efflux RND transporter periplasmic adaptor subunit [Alphaproteobacteria bacterium]|nr:efflux RND transporter periplasmic adaptor subunit [Alphaproteobacteria bacterium]
MKENLQKLLARIGASPVYMALGGVLGLLILFFTIRLLERPTKSFCQYVLSERAGEAALGKEHVVAVEAFPAAISPMSKRISTVGRLRANHSVILKSEMPGGQGRIKSISFEQGTAVQKGDTLIEFEDTDLKARVSRAKAELQVKQLEFNRVQQLFNQKIESQKKFDEASGALAMAQAQLEEAEANLLKAKIVAPFDGVAGIIDFSEGATVQNNQDLLKIVDESSMKIEFRVPERHVDDVGPGQIIELRVDAFKEQFFKGAVESVDSAVDTDTHSLNVRGSIENKDGQLRQGLFVNLDVVTGEQGDVLQIEETAIHVKNDQEFVYVIEKGKAIARGVLTGHRENGKIEIRSGLKPGQLVITAGNVQSGAKVRVTNELPKTEEPKDQNAVPLTDKPNQKPSDKPEEKSSSKAEGEVTKKE